MFAAAAEPKSIWVVDGASHQDFLQYDRAGYESNVLQFLTHYLSPVAFAGDRARRPPPLAIMKNLPRVQMEFEAELPWVLNEDAPV